MTGTVASAAILVIGNEILTGRTREANAASIAEMLAAVGVTLREVRIVADETGAIASAVNELRDRYTYLLTTGGIGPTHDDVTVDGVALAFGVGVDIDERALSLLRERVRPDKLTEARLRMARAPFGAELIVSPVTKAPGLRMGNVFVMAGLPQVLEAMLAIVSDLLSRELGPRPVPSMVDARKLDRRAMEDRRDRSGRARRVRRTDESG